MREIDEENLTLTTLRQLLRTSNLQILMKKPHHRRVFHPKVLLIQATATSEVRLLLMLLPPSLQYQLIKTIIIDLFLCLNSLLA